jgi:hypothetical protein
MKNKILRSSSGFVTADFVFSFLLSAMMTTLLFALCFSFTVIEISQYIAFSSNRAAIPARKNFDEQRGRVDEKFQQLSNNPVLRPLLTNGWFTLALRDVRLQEDPNDNYDEYNQGGSIVPTSGVRLTLTAQILNLNLGPFGRIESETGDGFSLTIGSLLFREPTQTECQNLIRTRYTRILELSDSYPVLGSVGSTDENGYFAMEDNGC